MNIKQSGDAIILEYIRFTPAHGFLYSKQTKNLIEYKINFPSNDNDQFKNLFDECSLCTFLLFKLNSVRQHLIALFTKFSNYFPQVNGN